MDQHALRIICGAVLPSALLVCAGCGTSTELSSNANPATVGNPVTFTAEVFPPPGFGAGTVLLEDGANVIGSGTPDFTGLVSWTTSNLAIGNHNIRAVYEGSGRYSSSTSNTVAEMIGPKPDVPVFETVHIPPVPGATGLAATDRVTSLKYGGVLIVQPADTLEFRLRIPWPTSVQVLVNSQPLQQVTPTSPAPQPDDPGYYTITANPMPGWPDKINPAAPGYNWFFAAVDVKLPKTFRYQNGITSLPAFWVTLRDVSVDGQTQAADVKLPVVEYPRPAYGGGIPTPPSSVFLSGDNSKDGNMENYIVATDVTLAGWLITDEDQQRGNSNQPCGSGQSEDWHYDLYVDSDFVQRNYAANSQPLASAIILGFPEHPFETTHQIPLTNGLPPDVGTFLMPGTGALGPELNSWHTNIRGPAPSTFSPDPNTAATGIGDTSHPNGCPTTPGAPSDSGQPVPGANPAAAFYPNNAWGFNVLTGSAFPPFPLPPATQGSQLRAGDYVILTGTLWQDIAHLISDVDANRKCFDDLYTGQGGWLELHPVDVVRYVTPSPPLRRHPEVVPLCAHATETTFLNRVVTPDDLPPDINYNLKFQEVVDPRFTNPNTIAEKKMQIDPCDPTKLDINMEVGNPNGFAYYKSVVLAWWEKSATPRPQPNCAPKTYNFVEISINTGDDDLRSDSAAMVSITGPDQSLMQSMMLKNAGAPGWGNNTTNDQKFALTSPEPLAAFGNFVLRLIESDPNCRNTVICISDCCDTWKIQSLYARAFNTSNGQVNGIMTDEACLYNNAGYGDWKTLTRSNSTVTLPAFANDATVDGAGCPTEPPPQFSLRSGVYVCPQSVNLSDADPNATIFYTTDGTTPTASSPQYSAQTPLTVTKSEVVTAIAVDGNRISPPSAASYTCHVAQPPEPVVCSVFDDNYQNPTAPSNAIFISGRTKNNEQGKACVPSGQFGDCHKWFGQCSTVNTAQPVFFNVFDDQYQNVAGPSNAIYISAADGAKACIPDGTSQGTCRKWFGEGVTQDGRLVTCAVFNDGGSNQSGMANAVYIPYPIPGPGSACIPDGTSQGTCRRWFGQCLAQ